MADRRALKIRSRGEFFDLTKPAVRFAEDNETGSRYSNDRCWLKQFQDRHQLLRSPAVHHYSPAKSSTRIMDSGNRQR
jgi:hypothetical protein